MAKLDVDAILAANTRARPGGKCGIAQVFARMDAATVNKLTAALDDQDGFAASGLVRSFIALGHAMSRSTVERHRRGDCVCHRT